MNTLQRALELLAIAEEYVLNASNAGDQAATDLLEKMSELHAETTCTVCGAGPGEGCTNARCPTERNAFRESASNG